MSDVEESEQEFEPGQEEEEYLHPLVRSGYKVIYDDLLTVEHDNEDQPYSVRVAVNPAEGNTEELVVELTLENDIYYCARCSLSAKSFEQFKKSQHLRKGETFPDFIQNVVKIMENVNSNRTTFRAIYEVSDSACVLTFKQQLEFKSIKIFALNFQQWERGEEYIKEQAQFRYNEKEHLLRDQIQVLKELLDHVDSKNPQLAQQLRRGSKFAAE